MMYSSINSGFEVSLFSEKEGIDYSYVLNNPITRFYLTELEIFLSYDSEMAMKMAKEIDRIQSTH